MTFRERATFVIFLLAILGLAGAMSSHHASTTACTRCARGYAVQSAFDFGDADLKSFARRGTSN